ncbi:MAG: hypothetical protein R6U10_03160 [Thermoplasmatota archaeon]
MQHTTVTGVIPNVTTGLLGTKAYNLVLTTDGIIVAQITKEMMREHVARVREESQGEGLLKRTLATMTSGYSLHQRYHDMHPADILAETPGNVLIPAGQIKSIKIKQAPYDDERRYPHKIRIKWAGGKETYSFTSMPVKEAKALIRQIYPGVK